MSDLSLTSTVELHLNIDQVFDLIVDGRIFALTGASSIEFDFEKDGPFKLDFDGCGSISGKFKEIMRPELVELSWDVEGFGRPEEHSQVSFLLRRSDEKKTELTIWHSRILSEESLRAKAQAWTEILKEFSAQ